MAKDRYSTNNLSPTGSPNASPKSIDVKLSPRLPPAIPPPSNLVLTVSESTVSTERNITFCQYLCGIKRIESHEITQSEWMGYLDGGCCYYKAKLLWTWLYYNFCCCH